jgi:hypothetical protein
MTSRPESLRQTEVTVTAKQLKTTAKRLKQLAVVSTLQVVEKITSLNIQKNILKFTYDNFHLHDQIIDIKMQTFFW